MSSSKSPTRSLRTKRKSQNLGDHGTHRSKRSKSPQDSLGGSADDMDIETIHEDDLCPICHLLIYSPVTTSCNHTLCSFCLNTWADVSVTRHMIAVGLDEDTPEVLLPNEIESSCPMCRTSSTAGPNREREEELQHKYPQSYAQRRLEAQSDEAQGSVETLTLYIGNTHRLIRQSPTSSEDEGRLHNKHEWLFFIRPSRTDLIEEIQIFLHPTFQNSRIIKLYPPYEIRRLGWGYFTIEANVVLKAGYRWVSSEADTSSDGVERGSLPLSWMLDFEGGGSQKRCRLKVVREKEGVDEENEAERVRVRRAWMRQREMDPDYEDGESGED